MAKVTDRNDKKQDDCLRPELVGRTSLVELTYAMNFWIID